MTAMSPADSLCDIKPWLMLWLVQSEDFPVLLDMLAPMTSLTELQMNDDRIPDEGVFAINRLLQQNTALRVRLFFLLLPLVCSSAKRASILRNKCCVQQRPALQVRLRCGSCLALEANSPWPQARGAVVSMQHNVQFAC